MIVIACGGRDFADGAFVVSALDALHRKTPISVLLNGGATGADRHALMWAASAGVDHITYHANWKKHGKAAGPRRNTEMLKAAISIGAQRGETVGLVAFAGGAGTADMKRQSQKANVKVWEPVQ
ncbi:DUF2493 domain-containing protein [Pseudomonas shirazensis]|uniref:YspA cpYpsA-related SLOG domain-containing protein n=3 Tax=Pseudomonas TaxID=286 RepID=B0KKM4_PSEPG|nr:MULTISPECIES: DUF2493 domain-containing protein [Pseudomonas]ABY99328.1 conserved hypothetical protein [Pseudomonas putida GB-1]AGZ34687.1 hypothetical protein PVLB_09445 [Pseudomonas sp. VLB120]MBP0706942.1 DUF2493 domain-containing protein [Pseudomonas sp. T34]MCK2186380.1 DUF2493 domain-containing protein [Pseudomonas sp. MB04B]MDD2083513.1 DUF2493 domain-containing protein [Pseudomonas putida]